MNPPTDSTLEKRIRGVALSVRVSRAIGWIGLLAFAPLLIAFAAMFAFSNSPDVEGWSQLFVALYWPVGLAGAAFGLPGVIFCEFASKKLLRLQRQKAGIVPWTNVPPDLD
jgi:hypothetical protein